MPLHDSIARTLLQLDRLRSGLKKKELHIPGFQLSYVDGGHGEALVLLHGFGASKENFGRLAAELKGELRIIAPDLPGFGESERDTNAHYSVGEQVERLRQFVDALGLGRFHLGGSSMGGQIAGSFAAKYPERVKSLLLLAPGGVDSGIDSPARRSYHLGRLLLVAKRPQDHRQVLALVTEKKPFVPFSVKRVLAQRAARDHDLHRRIYDEVDASPRLNALLPGLTTPTLVVWGRRDRALDVSGAAVLNELLPNASVRLLPGIGHLPMLETPKKVAGLYREFLKTL